jgi:nuclear-control-of-ATPase protein 2
MLELDQILRANEINFAILAALPAFFLSIVMLTVLRTWLKKVRSDNKRKTKCDRNRYI